MLIIVKGTIRPKNQASSGLRFKPKDASEIPLFSGRVIAG